ncbi:MAG TPA: peptidase M23, partial [Cytophagales bacterium]|nr:peptidase M23 [Cytophagales bacterium]
MSENHHTPPIISEEDALRLAQAHYGISGSLTRLPGEIDYNFRIRTKTEAYLLKISRPGAHLDDLDFQRQMMEWVSQKGETLAAPRILPTQQGKPYAVHETERGPCQVRLLNWIEGRLWSAVNPKTDALRHSLGLAAGKLTQALQGFTHPLASRSFDWDLAQAAWTEQHTALFSGEQLEIIMYFQERFRTMQPAYAQLRQGVIQNDANDNNVVVSEDLTDPKVVAIIDYGDAVHSQLINDVAIALAYAIMDLPDPLGATLPLVAGYHAEFPLQEAELEALHTLVAMRLVVSVTKSAINRTKEPENEYLQISEKPAWALLTQ